MRRLVIVLALLACASCKKSGDAPKPGASAAAAAPTLAPKLLGKWNDQDTNEIAWEFLPDGKCKAFGEMDCSYEVASESGSVLKLRYKPTETWEDVEVTFDGDKATWKNLTLEKADPEAAVTKLVRVK